MRAADFLIALILMLLAAGCTPLDAPEQTAAASTPVKTSEQAAASSDPVNSPAQVTASRTPLDRPEQEDASITPVDTPEQTASSRTPLPVFMVCGGLCALGKIHVLREIDGAWQVTGSVGMEIMS